MNRLIAGLVLAVLAGPCAAQTPSSAPPGNPTKFPTGDVIWSVSFTDTGTPPQAVNGSPPPPEKKMKSMEVTDVGNVERKIITWTGGKTTQNWRFADNHLTITTNTTDGSPACFADWNQVGGFVLRTGFDAASFSWLGPADFKGVESYQGKNCYHYKGPVPVVLGLHGPPKIRTMEAWIDTETFLPVALNDGTKLGAYTFPKDPPKGPLIPPKDIEDTFVDNTTPLIPFKK